MFEYILESNKIEMLKEKYDSNDSNKKFNFINYIEVHEN